MISADDFGRLDPTDWERLQEMAEAFEQAWQLGEPVALDAHLPPADDSLRGAALVELIKIDLELRRRHNCPIELESYARQFPEMGQPSEMGANLVFEEYRVRTQYGDKPMLAEYQRRFPQQFDRVLELVQERSARGGERAVPARNVRPRDSLSDLIMQSGEGYRFIERIGMGAFAEVYRGEAPGGIPVAIKRILKPIDADEARSELQALELIKRLRHPFLLATQAYWISANRLFVAMELAEGNLRGRLEECRRHGRVGLPAGELLGYVAQAGQAVDFLHEQKILHRDIKPENILVLQGFAKLADFGLARGPFHESMSTCDSGTPRYMAPEVWMQKTDSSSDQYGLALCYAELRQDRFPFPGRTRTEIMSDHLHAAPDLSGLADEEQRVVRRALSKDPGRRFENCRSLVDALRRALCQDPVLMSDSPRACENPLGDRIVSGPRDGPD